MIIVSIFLTLYELVGTGLIKLGECCELVRVVVDLVANNI